MVGAVLNTLFPNTPVAARPQNRGGPRGAAPREAANHDFFGNNLPEPAQPQPAFQVAPPSEEAIQTLMVGVMFI